MDTLRFDFQLAMLSGQSRLEKGQMELLSQIQACGILTKAAKAQGISYKTACAWMDALNRAADLPLVQANHGGKERGGTVITPLGEEYLNRYRRIQHLHHRMQKELHQAGDFAGFMQRLNLRTSARNHFSGVVEEIRGGSVRNLVHLQVSPDFAIQAQVSSNALVEMGLGVGSPVSATFKASSVLLEKWGETCQPLPVNCWKASPIDLREDEGGVEILLETEQGLLVSGLFELASWKILGLDRSASCMVMIPPAHVTLVKGG